MDAYLTIVEHTEYAKRMDDEHRRTNHRLEELEKALAQNTQLLISVEKLANSIKNMQDELKDQGERLDSMEAKDGEMWRNVSGYVITAVIGIVVGFIFKQLGM